MKERNKCVYIFVTDEPIEKEPLLFYRCRKNHIPAWRSCLSNEEILRLVKSLKSVVTLCPLQDIKKI